MSFYIYAKSDSDISCMDNIIDLYKDTVAEFQFLVENRRCFRGLEDLMQRLEFPDILAVNDIGDLGNNNADIVNRLDWFIQKCRTLVINSVPSTYEYGTGQPMNKTVLSTLLQAVVSNSSSVVAMTKRVSVGRNRMEFPENWEELYSKWEAKEISSKEFIAASGLKKATFYNLVTEYKRLQQINEDYVKRFMQA